MQVDYSILNRRSEENGLSEASSPNLENCGWMAYLDEDRRGTIPSPIFDYSVRIYASRLFCEDLRVAFLRIDASRHDA